MIVALPIDDLPHPVPDIAKLRWKENWLFVVMAPEQGCYALCHVNTEAAFDRARFTFNMVLDGKRYKYSNERPFEGISAFDRSLTDGVVRIDFVEPGHRFRLTVKTEEIDTEFEFSATHPTFDFAACRASAPHQVTFREQMTLGTNLPHDHHQQALTVEGRLRVADGASERRIQGLGYRDHSYCMRADSLIAKHSWCGLLFDDMVIGVKTSQMLSRQGVEAREGYVDDARGARVLTEIAVDVMRAADAFSTVRFTLESVAGDSYLIEADLGKSIAVMPFTSEKRESGPVYEIMEHLCPITDLRTGRTGLGHIELGLNSILAS
ncbi:hypothetical protein NUH86_18175 [Sphingobium sp. JS3065]|uniref:hypothetical protein n=1 Tax=Sphingobium sp. JS3065 TaxID=2970925 RepID=UPI0022653B97|nr:hypothetical protein [Sphingobium sp. JS3065]UZW57509.1 hypothetical protein NUH86_18175 [Sphingobium sp. JS3065]